LSESFGGCRWWGLGSGGVSLCVRGWGGRGGVVVVVMFPGFRGCFVVRGLFRGSLVTAAGCGVRGCGVAVPGWGSFFGALVWVGRLGVCSPSGCWAAGSPGWGNGIIVVRLLVCLGLFLV